MQLQKLDTTKKEDVRQFARFPFTLYRSNPYWVPPMQGELETVMNRNAHPFYMHSDADFFVVREGKDVLGRIAVLKNENFCRYHQRETAFFYYFESIDDFNVSELLLIGAEDWARQHGATELMGPKGFLRSNGLGLLVEGFNLLPAMGIPYNPPYYQELIERAGFEKETDHLSGFMNHQLTPRLHQAADRVIARDQFKVMKFKNRKDMLEIISSVEAIHKKAFENNPGFYPSTPQEFDMLARNIIAIADPKMIKVILHNDEIAGFIIAYRNINSAIQKVHGRIFPFGWISLLSAKRNSKIADLNGVGLLPEFQGLGGNVLLYSEVEKTLVNTGMKLAEIVQVDERNFKSKSDMEFMQVTWNKRHRTYKKNLS